FKVFLPSFRPILHNCIRSHLISVLEILKKSRLETGRCANALEILPLTSARSCTNSHDLQSSPPLGENLDRYELDLSGTRNQKCGSIDCGFQRSTSHRSHLPVVPKSHVSFPSVKIDFGNNSLQNVPLN